MTVRGNRTQLVIAMPQRLLRFISQSELQRATRKTENRHNRLSTTPARKGRLSRIGPFLALSAILILISIRSSSAHIDRLIPNATTAGGAAFTLRILGTDLDESDAAHVRFNGHLLNAVTLVRPSDRPPELVAPIDASLITTPGAVIVTIDGSPEFLPFTINSPLLIVSAERLPDGFIGQPYSHTMLVAGGTAPLLWSTGSIPGGSNLPPGLGLNTTSGLISGTPTALGTFGPILIKVTDAAGLSIGKSFNLTILPLGSCVYNISPTTAHFPGNGGSGTISISTDSNCPWSLNVQSLDMITLTSAVSGRGTGSFSYTVSPTTTDSRSTTIDVYRGLSPASSPFEGSVTVTQEKSLCPVEVYQISPTYVTHDHTSAAGGFAVTAPSGCKWTAVTEATWVHASFGDSTKKPVDGDGMVFYIINPNDGPWRGSAISINGRMFGVYQDTNGCPITVTSRSLSATGSLTADSAMKSSRRFRDEVLARSPRGRHYSQLYYSFSSEAVQIMLLHPLLLLKSREMLELYMPVVDGLLNGQSATLTEGDLAEIDDFLGEFASSGSAILRDAIQMLKADLRDPVIQTELGLTVKAGPKRELRSESRLPKFGGLGSHISLGVFLFLVARCRYRVSNRRFFWSGRIRISKAIIPFLAVTIAVASNSVSGHSIIDGGSLNQIRTAKAKNHSISRIEASLTSPPDLSFSTYLGGEGKDEGNSIAVDDSGNIYVTGSTDSRNFPVLNAAQANFAGGSQDAFVAKLNASGTQLIYATYLGGAGQDRGTSIAVDANGNAYVTGFTESSNFPVKNPLQPPKSGLDAFLVKLDSSGSIVFSTLLGGSLSDYGSSIAVDPTGVYVAGITTSEDFPVQRAAQTVFGGLADTFVAKFNQAGTRVIYATYLGGAGTDAATSIAVDSTGSAYVTGVSSSPNLPTVNAFGTTLNGVFDAFVTKISASGEQFIFSTYLGGSGVDRALRIAVNPNGNAYLVGDTDSADFPTVNPFQTALGGKSDLFLTKLGVSGKTLEYSTFLGGSDIDGGTSLAIDPAGNVTVAGFTTSVNFPIVAALQPGPGGRYDAFVARFNPAGSGLDYSTYLGGSGSDSAFGVSVDSAGVTFVMGFTNASDFPTSRAMQQVNGGGQADLFVARIKSNPVIDGASISGKNLIVTGHGFDNGAKIVVNDEDQKTQYDDQNPSHVLIGKKVGKRIASGQNVVIRVRNVDGALSNELHYTRP